MKRVVFKKLKIVLLISFISSSIFCCSKEDNSTSPQSEITPEKMEFVGIDHNKMLSQTYDYISKNKDAFNNKTNPQKIKEVEIFLVENINSKSKFSEKSRQLGAKLIHEQFSSDFGTKKGLLRKITLSEKEKFYLDNVNKMISGVYPEDMEVKNNIINLENDIQNDSDLTDQQRITLFSATATAKYSFEYWSKNIDNWRGLSVVNKNKSTTLKSTGPIGDIIKADIAGAAFGAAYAYVINALPGAGQAAYGATILASAVGGSVYQAVLELLNWLF